MAAPQGAREDAARAGCREDKRLLPTFPTDLREPWFLKPPPAQPGHSPCLPGGETGCRAYREQPTPCPSELDHAQALQEVGQPPLLTTLFPLGALSSAAAGLCTKCQHPVLPKICLGHTLPPPNLVSAEDMATVPARRSRAAWGLTGSADLLRVRL